jgi:hypothetical protein
MFVYTNECIGVLCLGCLGRVLFEVKSLRLSGILDSALHNGATNSVQGNFQCISWCACFAGEAGNGASPELEITDGCYRSYVKNDATQSGRSYLMIKRWVEVACGVVRVTR